MRRRDTYYGSHMVDGLGDYVDIPWSDTRYCVYYDEGMCKKFNCVCRVYGLCDYYVTKAGQRRKQENVIKEQIRREFQEMKQKEEAERTGKIGKGHL